jgi:hypothetical protein
MSAVTAKHAVAERQGHSWTRELTKRAYASIEHAIKRRRTISARNEALSRMRKLTELAHIAVSEALNQHYGFDEAVSERARSHCAARARAAADYLFGKPDRDADFDVADRAREQKAARDWLVRNELMRELVVQSLRVINAMNRNASKPSSVVGEGLLMAYGAGCFEVLDLPAYEAVVHRSIGALPGHIQQTIYYRWAMSQACR